MILFSLILRLSRIVKNKKQHIINSSISLLAKIPLASMDEIAKAAGIGRATLFRYFNNRQALVDEITLICESRMDEVIEPFLSLDVSDTQRLYLIINATIPMGDTFHFLSLEAYNIQNPRIHESYKQSREFWGKRLKPLQVQGVIDSQLPLEWLSDTIDNLILQAWESMNIDKTSHTEATRLVWTTLTKGIIKAG